MTEKDIKNVKTEISRLLWKINALERRIKLEPNTWHYGNRHTGAVKRASMDVSEALIRLRK